MYNCVVSMTLILYVGISIVGSIGDNTGWEDRMSVDMLPEESNVDSLRDTNDVRGKVELEIILDKRWEIVVR